jgi:hypothetical protein
MELKLNFWIEEKKGGKRDAVRDSRGNLMYFSTLQKAETYMKENGITGEAIKLGRIDEGDEK